MRLPSLLALACLALASAPATAAERPNIVLIFTDDHAYQAISAYGSNRNQTPNIDRLAKERMRFDRAFVTNSICGPSRAVILTGKYSHLNGFYNNTNGRFNGAQILKPETVAMMARNQIGDIEVGLLKTVQPESSNDAEHFRVMNSRGEERTLGCELLSWTR